MKRLSLGPQLITDETNYRRSTRDLYIQRLVRRHLCTVSPDGVRAYDTLFDRT